YLDPQGNSKYKLNGMSEVLSVPYALHAKSADTFTGTISPAQLPDFYTAAEIDEIFLNILSEGTSTSGFSGDYQDLENKPLLFSGLYNDLKNKPEIYTKAEINNLIQSIDNSGVAPQHLKLEGKILSISGGNSISFENWDSSGGIVFSGNYEDLQNKPELFSGEFNDLKNTPVFFSGLFADLQDKPELYDKTEIDKLIEDIQTSGGSSFSGIYDDLMNKPEVYNRTEIDMLIEGIETAGGASFSGNYDDLENKPVLFSGLFADLQYMPELYDKTEIDKIIEGIETTGGSFSGNYDDLENKPVLFSGLFADLQDKPELYDKTEIDKLIEGIETSVGSSFSGIYDDLQNKPEIYSRTEIDNLIQSIETTGVAQQNLNLDGETLSISGGNSISFANWDTNAADDFSGLWDDLQNKPELYNKTEIDKLIQDIE